MNLSLRFFRNAVDRSWKSMHAVCGLPTCPNTLIMRSVGQSQVGIRVGQLWYCSVDCFAGAAFTRMTALSSSRVVEMPHNPRMSIGLVMLSKGYLTDEQLRFAMTQSQLHGEELECILLRLGLANEWQLTSARAIQWGHPVFGQDGTGQTVEADLPPALLSACSTAPLHYSLTSRRLVVGFVNRVEHSLLDSLEHITGCRAESCFITPTTFGEQMARLTPAQDYEEVFLADPLTPAQMAKAVAGLAVEIGAKEAIFTNYRNFVWTRLIGKRRKLDVVFQSKSVAEPAKGRKFSFLDENMSSLG